MKKENRRVLLNNPSPRCLRTRPLPPGARETTRGFTLIELLVVVLIIGILAAVAVPQYQKAVDKTRIANLVAIGNTFLEAQRRYYLANGTYASERSALDISLPKASFTIDLQSDYLYVFGTPDYFPGILLIFPYNGKLGNCHARDDNARAIAACQHLCQQKSLVVDGQWKACNFKGV